jgi:hypothetical protein
LLGVGFIFGVLFSDTVIITVKIRYQVTSTKDREDIMCAAVNSGIWSVWFSGTVIVGCGGDP